jgi:flagellar biosynthesis protein FlhB
LFLSTTLIFDLGTVPLISFRLDFRKTISALYLQSNLVTSPIKGILEIKNFNPRCIPMQILSWTDRVRSCAGKISYIDIVFRRLISTKLMFRQVGILLLFFISFWSYYFLFTHHIFHIPDRNMTRWHNPLLY